MPNEISWSFGRTPNPCASPGSYFAATLSDPSWLVSAPHVSPEERSAPTPVGFCALLLRMLQSTRKLPFVSAQFREPELTDVFTGLLSVAMFVDSLWTYLA